MKDFRLLLATGTPKSGTTFLQMILNAHPEVSCPAEHRLEQVLRPLLTQLIQKYNEDLKLVDEKTGRQGPSLYTEEDFDSIFAYMVMVAALRGAQNNKKKRVKWFGLNENPAILNLDFFAKMFPKGRFICIVRDPRNVTLSSWYFNLRTWPNFVKEVARSLEDWAPQMASIWVRENQKALEFQKKHPEKILFVRYEDLVLEPERHYPKIFEFLEVDTRPKIIQKIIEATRFDRFKDGKFFRKASIEDWKKELSLKAIRTIEEIAGPLMRSFGYEAYQS